MVSIHAPTRGATTPLRQYNGEIHVSIHAPTRGATNRDFWTAKGYGVSIHAPTRGATILPLRHYQERKFQSTHPHGVRRTNGSKKVTEECFNPRTHTGCDLRLSLVLFRLSSFNPRTHTGCDVQGGGKFDFEVRVSIHAPTRGATSRLSLFPLLAYQFQSTHPHGVRLSRGMFGRSQIRFNPRTHTGCDPRVLRPKEAAKCFNPRTHTGCD